MSDWCIELENVSVTFPVFSGSDLSLKNAIINKTIRSNIRSDNDGVVLISALSEINLKIRSRERVGLVGHNGSGKSSLLRLLSKIYHPTHGSAKINGSVASLLNVSLGLDNELTGKENLVFRLTLLGLTTREIEGITNEIISFADLGAFIDLPVRTYSSGMLMRLAFSVSTAVPAQILLLDEWLSTGDEQFSAVANSRLQSLVDSTEVLILASHSRELIEKNCTRVLWMENSRIRMDGATNEVLDAYFG